MREHFRFLSAHRKLLRVKVNAAEDLLLNGAREPEHRGVCLHLLGKVDRACVNAAVARTNDPATRTLLLEGVVRLSGDVAIIVLYLESLKESGSRDEAAGALGDALRRLDFNRVSAAQMSRVLDLAATLLGKADLPQVVLGLLQNRGFRQTFDQSIDRLPTQLAELYVPVRAAHAALFENNKRSSDRDTLTRGITLLLGAADKTLRAHPAGIRQRLIELGMELPVDSSTARRALATLVNSFPKDSRQFSLLAMQRARTLLAEHCDDDARELLIQMRDHQKNFKLPGRLLAALDAERVDRVALLSDEANRGRGKPKQTAPLRPGLWLDRQRPVWICVGEPNDAARFEDAAALHRKTVLPGVAQLLLAGTGAAKEPYRAFPRTGVPAVQAWHRQRLDPADARDLAIAGIEILSALALASIALPDVDVQRFLAQGTERLWLWDLAGAHAATVEQATHAHVALARQFWTGLLGRVQGLQLPPHLARRIDDAADLPALTRALAEID